MEEEVWGQSVSLCLESWLSPAGIRTVSSGRSPGCYQLPESLTHQSLSKHLVSANLMSALCLVSRLRGMWRVGKTQPPPRPVLKNCFNGGYRILCKAVNPHGVGPVVSEATLKVSDIEKGAVNGLVEEAGCWGRAWGISGISFGEQRERWQGETRPSKLEFMCHRWRDGRPSLSGQPGTWFVLQPQLLACRRGPSVAGS